MKICEPEANDITAESIYRSVYLFNEDKYEYEKYIRKSNNKQDVSIFFFTKIVAKIKFSKKFNSYYISISNDYSDFFPLKNSKMMPPIKDWIRYLIENHNDLVQFKDPFSDVYLFLESDYSDDDEFACCHLYNECSDETKCIQQNVTFSNRCYYKKNLNDGRIFYGKNRNV